MSSSWDPGSVDARLTTDSLFSEFSSVADSDGVEDKDDDGRGNSDDCRCICCAFGFIIGINACATFANDRKRMVI